MGTTAVGTAPGTAPVIQPSGTQPGLDPTTLLEALMLQQQYSTQTVPPPAPTTPSVPTWVWIAGAAIAALLLFRE